MPVRPQYGVADRHQLHLGIGAGMVIPLSTGLVVDYFTGDYRVRQLGYSSAINNLTLVIATVVTGYLPTLTGTALSTPCRASRWRSLSSSNGGVRTPGPSRVSSCATSASTAANWRG